MRRGRTRGNRASKLEESDLVRRMERIERLITENVERRNDAKAKLPRRPTAAAAAAAATRTATATPSEPALELDTDADSASLANVGRIYCAGYKLGDINMFHGVPFLSREGQKWIGLRVDDTDGPASGSPHEVPGPLWENRLRPAWPDTSRSPADATSLNLNGGFQELPPRALVQEYLDAYLRSEVSDVFPLADPVLFPQILDEVYSGRSDFSHAGAAKACVLAFLLLAATLLSNPVNEPLPPIDVSGCGTAAEHLFVDVLNASASTEAVGALMMLAVYQFTCGHLQPVDISLSVASRLLFMLGAHLYPGQDLDVLPSDSQSIETRTILHRRDLFWICYGLDKDITFRTGRPPIMNDTSCDLTFPKWYSAQRSVNVTRNFRLPGDLRLSLIKSKAYEKLYSPHSLQKPDAEILGDIRELDELLENWRLSQPTGFRPKLSFSLQAKSSIDCLDMDPRSFFTRMDYFHCMTTIHQASSRCKDWAHNHRVLEGLSSSLNLALESSRSLLSSFHAADSVLLKLPSLFWIVLFYPLSATLVLFCNILLNPASPAASSDTILLRDCLNHIGDKVDRVNGLSDSQLLHLQTVHSFTAEVVRSAESLVLQSQHPTS
ncbi:hypothetical protein A1O3_09994 [Capronia epimyces CBS 606.96]|uniref:Xylanolytic transcriptional activator regulatory domain-containing protein n=1 Tax=Capronia epimyces CBS 606.96 TaxID=1182542 RepID=W9XK79_9EURO|nr:uncharacterized protein A1O3_09994 [Capronia epimyces CBS 606.96]EXJ77765.1 hypothetical protein A1O3_09994 [Capronia epimyces CBS 606.96]